MPLKKISQIDLAGRRSNTTDFLVGVDSGNTDLLFTGGPAGSTNQIQFNDGGAWAGDANLTFYPSGTAAPGGSTYGGLVNLRHMALGSGATSALATFAAEISSNVTLKIHDKMSGNLGALAYCNNIYNVSFFDNSGTHATYARGINCIPWIIRESTSTFGELGNYFEAINQGQGNITAGVLGIEGKASHYGSGTVGGMIGVGASVNIYITDAITPGNVGVVDSIECEGDNIQGATVVHRSACHLYSWYPSISDPGTVNNNYGLNIYDHSGVTGAPVVGTATNRNWNIWSQGTASLNIFDGSLVVGAGTAITAGGSTAAKIVFSGDVAPHTGSNPAVGSPNTTFGIYYGSGAPTISAAKGSWYLRSDGTGTNDRAYVNTNGSTTWTALTTAA